MFEPNAKTPSLARRRPDPGAFEAALEFPYEAEHGRTAVPAGAMTRERPIVARILWPALGFPAVIAPRSASYGAPTAQRSICVLLVSDRPTLTAEDAARQLRVVPWAERDRRRIEQGQPGSFRPADLTVRNDAPQGRLTKAQKDDRGDLIVFGGEQYEDSIVVSLSRAVRTFYATQGLRHLHEIRVAERASAQLPDGHYHVFWNGSADGGPSDELRMLVDHFAVPRRRRLAADTEAERWWHRQNLGFLVDEYRFEYGALHPPYQACDARRRFTEVLHPLFVRRGIASLKLAHLTDTHVDVRADVYEHNLRRAPKPMSVVGGELRYRGIPVQFNNWNKAFTRQYEHATKDADAILITGDLIDYGRGHVGLIHGGRYRHELGVDGRYHADRNWFLFYYLLASGARYRKPVYVALGNHDWRLNPYPPFARGAPGPEAFVHNYMHFKGPGRDGWLRDIIRQAHGPGHGRRYAYPDLDLRTVARAAAGYLAGNLDFSGSPLQTTVESVIWYLLLINPFLDYAFALPTGHQVLMLDWGEDEEVINSDEPRSWMGFGPRAANSLSPLQRWHATSFARSRGNAKVVGVHAPLLGPYPDWTDNDLRQGTKAYRPGEDPLMRQPDGSIIRVSRHTITAIRPKSAPLGVSAEYGSIVRERDRLIRELGTSSSGVRLVLSGHIHRHGLLVAYPLVDDRDSRLLRSVTFAEARGARRGVAAVRREAGRVKAFPAPLYVNTTSAGPLGSVYGAKWRAVTPGWMLVTLAADGTIETVWPRQLGVPEAGRPRRPAAASGVSPVTR